VVLYDWKGFARLVEEGVADKMGHPGDSTKTLEAGIRAFLEQRPDLMFLHLDSLDSVGHKSGFGSKPYLKVLAAHDALIGKFLEALTKAGLRDETLVLITADHGGKGKNHGGGSPQELRIPLFLVGPTVLNVHLRGQIRIYDIAATIAHVFHLPIPRSWLGKPILEALQGPDGREFPKGPITAQKAR
jgi:phosphopentomutase